MCWIIGWSVCVCRCVKLLAGQSVSVDVWLLAGQSVELLAGQSMS